MLTQEKQRNRFKISELAKAAGVHVETVRYYQGIGLMQRPRRDQGRMARYDSDALHRLRFIRRAQGLGFSLEEVAMLLGLAEGEHCAETKALAERKLALVAEKIRDLAAMRDTLRGLVTKCAPNATGRGCPIIDALAQGPAETARR
ncbi:MAG TPA: MerR family DNA-binding protein [Burkholderiales bacterium]|jgi:MerR family mercuric resistance operon transcriptional regulator|nr:MerR family DNA-binding protein [Burkholderiales bacterium]